jgi:DNA-binding response OmpR family regulator
MHIAPVIRQGEFEGTVSVFRDITREVEVDRMKSEFVSSVSHELRTPMTSIKGYIDLLYGGMVGTLNDGQKQFLQIVKNNTDRLILLVNDLLDISSLQSGKVKLALEPVDPVAVVDEVLTTLAPDAAERRQTLKSAIAEPLPSVRADPHRLIQILGNLCKNAIKYTPAEGRILVDAEVVEESVHFHIIDNGVGISEEDQKKLFTRFFRADNPLVQSSSGTGLGLPIVRSIVELHGGEIWFESASEKGSTFSFSIPLATQDARSGARREFRTISYRPQDRRVLIVGEETERVNALAHRLRDEGGYRVQIVSSGRDALDQLAADRHAADLIALNLRLPDMDGLEAVQRLRRVKSLAEIPVVLLAVLHRPQGGRWVDAETLLCEPIEAGELMSAVDQMTAPGARILLIESDQALSSLLYSELGARGFQVSTCSDDGQAIDALRTEEPGLILLDLKSPGLSGFDVLRALGDAPEAQGIPLILISTGLTGSEDETQRLLGMGAARVVAKPLLMDELVAEIQAVLEEGPAR